ncbi:MAG: hypothetical protein OEZ34_14905, partial [Spirochaetia bacterium]|nr:hypothetical protein [Spirochaetia bacterium]
MTDPDQFIAAARITSLDQNKKVLNCTYGGDSLKILQPPFECSLFILKNKPLSSTEVIKPAIEGISKIPGTFLNITVTSI